MIRIDFWIGRDECPGPITSRIWPAVPRVGDKVYLPEIDDSRDVEEVEWTDDGASIWFAKKGWNLDRDAIRAGGYDVGDEPDHAEDE